MKHLKFTFVGFLALTAAASDASAFGLLSPRMGSGPGGTASGAVGNAPGPGGDVGSGNVVGGTSDFGGSVTVFRGGREYYRGYYGRGAYYRGWGPFAAGAAAGAEAGSAAASTDKASAYHYYTSPYYNGNGTCWNPYYQHYYISFAPCAAYTR